MEEIIQFDKQLLLMLNGSDSSYLDQVVLILTNGLTWIPLYVSLLFLVIKNNHNWRTILLIVAGAGLCVLMAGTLDDEIVKPLVARWRPTHDPQIGSLVDVVNDYRGGRYGFFSAHASNTFSIALFFSLLVRYRWLTVGLVSYSLVNCWTRLYLGVHYPGDILVGLLWGTVTAISVYSLFRFVNGRWVGNHRYTSQGFTSSGYEYRTTFVPLLVLILTVVYALLRPLLG
jgi:undecaprenyl-diphosphatase